MSPHDNAGTKMKEKQKGTRTGCTASRMGKKEYEHEKNKKTVLLLLDFRMGQQRK